MRAQASCKTIQHTQLIRVASHAKPQVAGRVITWPPTQQSVPRVTTAPKKAQSLSRRDWLELAGGFSVFLILYTLANSITGC